MANIAKATCCHRSAYLRRNREEDGLVTVKRGVGMFVAKGARVQLRQAQREDFIKNVWPPVERQMKRLDLTLEDLVKSDA